MNKFDEFAKEEKKLDGEKERIDDILDKQLSIIDFRINDSKFSNKSGKYATVQFYENSTEKKHIFFTGSDVLIDQLQRYKDKLPYSATIKKINRYYTLS